MFFFHLFDLEMEIKSTLEKVTQIIQGQTKDIPQE